MTQILTRIGEALAHSVLTGEASIVAGTGAGKIGVQCTSLTDTALLAGRAQTWIHEQQTSKTRVAKGARAHVAGIEGCVRAYAVVCAW